MNCKNCETELTEMKNDKGETTCLRCLSCHPITEYVAPTDKETKYVDIPWTKERILEVVEERIREVVQDEIENWHIPPDIDDEIITKTKESAEHASVEPNVRPNWRSEAKDLGVPLYDKEKNCPRLKVDVLAEIEEKKIAV